MSERIESEILPISITAERVECEGHPNSSELAVSPEKGVRERSAESATHRDYQDRAEGPAHPSNRRVAQLNANWRVVDDLLQWRLQRKKGNPRAKNPGWIDRYFCSTQAGLLRCIREHCREVEPVALGAISALPEHHWMQNLDVRGTDRAQVEEQSEPLGSQGLEGLQT